MNKNNYHPYKRPQGTNAANNGSFNQSWNKNRTVEQSYAVKSQYSSSTFNRRQTFLGQNIREPTQDYNQSYQGSSGMKYFDEEHFQNHNNPRQTSFGQHFCDPGQGYNQSDPGISRTNVSDSAGFHNRFNQQNPQTQYMSYNTTSSNQFDFCENKSASFKMRNVSREPYRAQHPVSAAEICPNREQMVCQN